MIKQYDPAKITTPEGWQWFDEIMRALQLDGGSVVSVSALMDVAERVGRQTTRLSEQADRDARHAHNLLCAVPTRAEAEQIWRMYVGPGATLPDPDPEWVKTYLRSRCEEAPDVTL